jgi:thiamine biosynthesis lipoprotein
MTGTDTRARDWTLWSTSARLVLAGPAASDPAALDHGIRLADDLLAQFDAACSRFRSDSELSRIHPGLPDGTPVSPLLATLVRHALDVAELTDGRVDPTLRYALDAVGYDRDIELIADSDQLIRAVVAPRPGWQSVSLVGDRLRLPAHLGLDLGATAKAVAADLVAERVSEEIGCGVLVSLGGDIATAGPAPALGWNITVQDLPQDPAARVRLTSGRGLATSSTQKRRWNRAGLAQHHILDPASGLPAEPVWRSVTVAAGTCLRANAFSTAAIVAGRGAVALLSEHRLDARLVDRLGTVVTTGGWPADSEIPAPERSAA